LKYRQTFRTDGNVLDMTCIPSRDVMIYTLDTAHRPGSVTEIDSKANGRPFVKAIEYDPKGKIWKEEAEKLSVTRLINSWAWDDSGREIQTDVSMLSDLLYSSQHLRKREVEADGRE